jgi:hypothetical protein
MTFGEYELKLQGTLLGIFEFKFVFCRQSSNVTSWKFEHFIERNFPTFDDLHIVVQTIPFILKFNNVNDCPKIAI